MTEEDRSEAKRVRWDGTITLGNVVTAAAMVVTVLVWGVRLEGYVERHAERLHRLEISRERDDRESSALRESLAELRANQAAQLDSLRRLERGIEALGVRRP